MPIGINLLREKKQCSCCYETEISEMKQIEERANVDFFGTAKITVQAQHYDKR